MNKSTFLCVANWDSNVGYAWWLMESFWIAIAQRYYPEFDVTLAYPTVSSLPVEINQSNLNIDEIDFNATDFVSVLSQFRYLQSKKVKYIYLTDWSPLNWRYLVFRLAGVEKVIVHDHTPGQRSKPGIFKFILKCVISRISYLNADGIIGATEFVKNRLISINCLPASKCYSAPNGIRLDRDVGSPEKVDVHKRFDIPENCLIIVSAGRANLYKGVDFALKVVKELVYQRNIDQVHYLYLGDGPHLDAFREIAKDYGIQDHCSFVGRVKNVPEILNSCHIALHTSRGEVGYSLSILEYMYAELPVVVPNNPSVCEATKHNETGFIYEEDNIQSAVAALEALIFDKDKCAQLGRKGKKTVTTSYSLRQCHKRLLSSLDLIIN